MQSFTEIQKADQEEMKRQNKIRAAEMEQQKKAAASTKAQASSAPAPVRYKYYNFLNHKYTFEQLYFQSTAMK